ncbi:putative aspartate aminotransferase [Diplonema papillatum]|nr:putative aspartate aminotransferase [Diplonema papillatum]
MEGAEEIGFLVTVIVAVLMLVLVASVWGWSHARKTEDAGESGGSSPDADVEKGTAPQQTGPDSARAQAHTPKSVYSCVSHASTPASDGGGAASPPPPPGKQGGHLPSLDFGLLSHAAFPECGDAGAKLHDWGPGLKACESCGARPIWNRGCRQCKRRMCPTCFEAHKKLRLSTLHLAQAAVAKFSANPASDRLLHREWNSLLSVLGIPAQSEQDFAASCVAHGDDPDLVGITLPHLVVLLEFIAPDSAEALARILPTRGVPTALAFGSQVAEESCALQSKPHDFGPGLSHCASCDARPIFNRGCRACLKRLCPSCFASHAEHALHNASPRAKYRSGSLPSPYSAAGAGRCLPPGCLGNVPAASPCVCSSSWNVTATPENVDKLSEGGSFLYFRFCKAVGLTQRDLSMADLILNESAFADETAENNVPRIDLTSEGSADLQDYILCLNKAVYALPSSAKISSLDPKFISSFDYQTRCQPRGTKVQTTDEADTFRFTKPLVWPVYSITLQFRVSEIDPADYPRLAPLCDGLAVHKALLLERTKRDKQAVDLVKKAKSVLLYHEPPGGGLLVTNVTVCAATSVPGIIASIVDKLGSMGAKDVSETATRTRACFRHYALNGR